MRGLRSAVAAFAVLTGGFAAAGSAASKAEVPLMTAKASLVPEVHLFAEPVVAHVDVVVDRSRVDPSRIQLDATFAPYERVGGTSVERHDIGGLTYLRYTMTLRCLEAECIPPTKAGQVTQTFGTSSIPAYVQGQTRDDKRTYRFQRARILYADPESGTRGIASARWPRLRSLSRVNWSDPNMVAQGFPFRASLAPLPEATYRASPPLLGFALLGVAAALLLLPAALVVQALRRRAPPEEPVEPELSRLDRALLALEAASARPEDERRRALEALAVELEAEGSTELAGSARRLAWSRHAPGSEVMERFAVHVHEGDHAPA